MPIDTALAPSVECGRHAPPVADSAGGDHRDVEMIDEPRNQRDESDELPFGVGVIERAAVASGLEPLRDDRVGAGRLRAPRIGERVRGGPPRDALSASSGSTNAGG